MGSIGLQKVRSNRVCLVIDQHQDPRICELVINAASAARAPLGLDYPVVVKLDPPIPMWGEYSSSGRAVGRVEELERMCEVLSHRRTKFDGVALGSVIDVPGRFHHDYYESHGELVNPWGALRRC